METFIHLLATSAPMIIFGVAMIIRFIADSVNETRWSGAIRPLLMLLSYALVAIGLVSLIFTALVSGYAAAVMLVIYLIAVGQMGYLELRMSSRRKMSGQSELLWVLATAVRSNRNLSEDLIQYADGTTGRRRRLLLGLAKRLSEGTPASEIVVPQGLLSDSVTLEIQGGLQSGRFEEALSAVARRQTRELATDCRSNSDESFIVYSSVLLMVMVVIVGFVMYYIIPKLKRIFDDFDVKLPAMTVKLIDFSDAFVNYWYLLTPVFFLPVFMVLVIACAEYYGWTTITRRFFGAWFSRPHTPLLLRYLSHSIASNRPLPEVFDGLLSSSIPTTLKHRSLSMKNELLQGVSCWQTLRNKWFINRREATLLDSAERVGNLPWTLNAIADSLDRRWSYRVRAAIQFVGPALTVAFGFLIAFVVISLFLPLIKLLHELS